MKGVIGMPRLKVLKNEELPVEFRSQVEPGNRLYLLGHIIKYKKRKNTSHVTTRVQGVVNSTMAFEALISGMGI